MNKKFDGWQKIGIISIALAHRIDCVATFNTKDFEPVAEIRLYPF